MTTDARRCPSCGESAAEKYCAKCGEQIQLRPDYSFRGLLAEMLNVVTNFESNIFRSFASILTKPGLLTTEYFAGRRKRYLKPLQIFIFCNVVFFFFQALSGFNSMRTPLRVHLYRMPYSRFVRPLVANQITKEGTTLTQYETRFNTTIETQAKTLIFLMIPMFAIGLELIYLIKKEYFVKHLVFSTHFFSFYLLLLSVFYVVISSASKIGLPTYLIGDVLMTLVVLGISFVYLMFAARRTYNQSYLWAALSALGSIAVLAVVVQTYRFVLFFTAFYSI
jgi:hypothetical protein